MSEHENWVRYWCLSEAVKRHPYATPETILESAAKFANFVLDNKPATVLKLTGENDNT